MYFKMIVPFLAVILAVVSAGMPGAPVDADMNDEGVQNALQFAVAHYNRQSNDAFVSQVSEVIQVQKQVVSGLKYIFTVNMGRTNCRKGAIDTLCAFHEDPNVARNNRAKDFMKKVTLYSTDEEVLRRMLAVEDTIDWSTYFLIGGCYLRHSPILKETAASQGVSIKGLSLVHLMTLTEPSHLPELITSDLESRLSVLNESHANVVNKTWKFGGDDKGYRNILNLIRHFPTCCITDENNQPVSWVLLYDYCAMGMLYTQPEHRGKGYAKALVTTMAKRLHSQGYAVYCFIEECNPLSYKLFKSMGFTEDSSYRAVWYEFIC